MAKLCILKSASTVLNTSLTLWMITQDITKKVLFCTLSLGYSFQQTQVSRMIFFSIMSPKSGIQFSSFQQCLVISRLLPFF